MPLRTSIHNCLKADAAVTALIGSGASCRHYPVRVPLNPPVPFVASFEIYGSAANTHGDGEDVLDETQIQFSCYAVTAEDAHALRSAVRSALINDEAAVLSTAHIVVTAPETREVQEEAVGLYCAQIDLTFFHNPRT